MPESEAPENTDAATENDSGADSTTDKPDTGDEKLGEGGKKALEAERQARAKAEADLKAARDELQKHTDKDKSELQKALERAEAAEKRAEKAEFGALRSKVAQSKGVPAGSLTGTTEEELTASADELIAWRDAKADNKPPAPKRTPQTGGGLKSGATGTGSTTTDPKQRAAEALRQLRNGG